MPYEKALRPPPLGKGYGFLLMQANKVRAGELRSGMGLGVGVSYAPKGH